MEGVVRENEETSKAREKKNYGAEGAGLDLTENNFLLICLLMLEIKKLATFAKKQLLKTRPPKTFHKKLSNNVLSF